jgi:hypothetical protein
MIELSKVAQHARSYRDLTALADNTQTRLALFGAIMSTVLVTEKFPHE